MSHNALLELQNLDIPEIIARLYEVAGIPFPTPAHPLVPLHRLIGGQCLKQAELADLSSRAALDYLQQSDNIRVAWLGANGAPLSGFLYANSGGGCLLVRREDSISRRRFCAAHELGHYVLHWPRVLAQSVSAQSENEFIEILPPASNPEADELSQGEVFLQSEANLPPFDEMEHEADSFAGDLLMPEIIVRALAAPLRAHCSDSDLARRLSHEMLVSRAAMMVRLRHLGLLRGENARLN